MNRNRNYDTVLASRANRNRKRGYEHSCMVTRMSEDSGFDGVERERICDALRLLAERLKPPSVKGDGYAEVARHIGGVGQTISKIVNRESKPSPLTARRLAEYLEVSMQELLYSSRAISAIIDRRFAKRSRSDRVVVLDDQRSDLAPGDQILADAPEYTQIIQKQAAARGKTPEGVKESIRSEKARARGKSVPHPTAAPDELDELEASARKPRHSHRGKR